MSRYAYVQGNPTTSTDPDGHCWPLCTMLIGALIGAAVGAGISIVSQAASGKPINWGQVGKDAAVGAITGAISGLAGPEAGIAVHAAVGAAAGAAGQVVSNALGGKPLGDGVLQAALIGGVTGGAMRGAGKLFSKFGGKAVKAVEEDLGAVCPVGNSFSADTAVTTPSGAEAIKNLKVGDQVQGYDPATKQVTTQTVDAVYVNHDTDLLNVTVVATDQQNKQQQVAVASHGSQAPPSETVHTTFSHPWLTADRGWIDAGNLVVGEQVQRLDGRTATVVQVRLVAGAADMYDLTVHAVHTFAVGTIQAVVHNCGGKEIDAAAAKAIQEGRPAGVRIQNSNGTYGDTFVTGEATPRGPFQGIIKRMSQGRGNYARYAGGCAETIALCAATKNPINRGKDLTLWLWHAAGKQPCQTCQTIAASTVKRGYARSVTIIAKGFFRMWGG